jgi:putative ABC transport system ATP-binding protein
MKSIIKLENVWKIYKMGEVDVPALQGLNLTIGALDIPTKGKIFLNNHNIARLEESTLAQIRGKTIGYIFQTFNLIPSLSALDNVMLPMTFQNMAQEDKLQIAKERLIQVGLEDRMTHLPSELSGGQRQRVAIARALVNNQEVILADEPTGNLDSKTGKEIMELLTDLNKKEGKTLILVTHDNDLAKKAERIAHLKDGTIINTNKDGMIR